MTRLLTGGLVVACAVALLGAAGQQPIFRGAGEAVYVYVTVTDRDGRLVTDLTRDAFEVRDEGKPQPITLFDNTPQPIRLIVMLDVSGSMEGNLPLLRAASDQLFARLLRDDVVRLGTFGNEVTISPEFTSDTRLLRAALPEAIDPNAQTPLWRGLDDAMEAFGDERPTRPVILVLSDGGDSGFQIGSRFVTQAEVIDRARRDDVMIYAVGMRGRSSRPNIPGFGAGGLQAALNAERPDPGLARVAEESGGGYIEIDLGQDLGAAFSAVADELHSQYLIAFEPPKRDGKKHDIDVRVSGRGLEARARKDYVAPKGD